MKNTSLRIIAVSLAAGFFMGLLPFSVHADTVNSANSNSVNGIDPLVKLSLYEDDFGYIEPEESLYDLPARSNRNTRTAILENWDGLKINAAIPFYYITSDPGYDGNGRTPSIAEYAMADDQGATSLCWIYSTLKAIEINMGIHGYDRVNLSEKSVAYWFWNQIPRIDDDRSEDHGLADAYNKIKIFPAEEGITEYNKFYCKGGWDAALDSYFTAWKGFAGETGDNVFINKYKIKAMETIPCVSDVYSGIPDRIRNIYHVSATDKETIKRMIMKYGAATTAVQAEDNTYSTGKSAWYTKNGSSNHQIIIIGWDDGYSRDNFNGYYGRPSNDGAWYCINSWDTGWENWGWGRCSGYNDYKCDNNGGFWMSYETGYMQNKNHEVEFYEISNKKHEEIWYDHNYAGGAAGNWDINYKSDFVSTFSSSNTAEFKRQGICYTVDNERGYSETVGAVGFDTFETETEWILRTYSGEYNNKKLIDEQEISLPLAGYHTVELEKPFEVGNNASFYVELEPVGKGRLYNSKPGYSVGNGDYDNSSWYVITRFGSSFGETYINGVKRTDRQSGIHVFTTDVCPDMSTDSRITAQNLEITYGSEPCILSDLYAFEAGTDRYGNPDTIRSITSDNSSVQVDPENDSIAFLKAGTSTVKIQTTLGYSASFTVTVGRRDISETAVSGIKDIYYTGMNGLPVKPVPAISFGDMDMVQGTDYYVSYSNNNAAGYATVAIEGKGNFCGNRTITYQIMVVSKSTLSFIDSLKVGYVGEEVDLDGNYIFIPGIGTDGYPTTVSLVSNDTSIVSVSGTIASLIKEGYTTVTVTSSDGISLEIGVQVLDNVDDTEETIIPDDGDETDGDKTDTEETDEVSDDPVDDDEEDIDPSEDANNEPEGEETVDNYDSESADNGSFMPSDRTRDDDHDRKPEYNEEQESSEETETISPADTADEKDAFISLRKMEKKAVNIAVPEFILSSEDNNVTRSITKTRYKSSDKKVAKVNKKGVVTAGKKSGSALITRQVQVLTVTRISYFTNSGKEKIKKKKSRTWADAGTVRVIVE